MRDVFILFIHLIVTAVRVMRPGGVRSVVAESVHLRHQLLVLNRPRKRHNTICAKRLKRVFRIDTASHSAQAIKEIREVFRFFVERSRLIPGRLISTDVIAYFHELMLLIQKNLSSIAVNVTFSRYPLWVSSGL